MHKILIASLCIVFLFVSLSISSQPALTILSWDNNTLLNGKSVVHIQKGDNSDYATNNYNDSTWRVSSFPFNPDDYAFAGTNPENIFWYRIHVRFPQDLPTEAAGISLGKIADIDETYLNGVLIGKTGDFKNPRSHVFDKTRIYQIPTKYIIPGEDNIISIRVKNTYRADEMPGRGNYYIGNYDKMKSDFLSQGFSELFFPVVYLIASLYFLLLFIKRTKQIDNLFYALFAGSWSVYSVCRSSIKYEIIPSFDFNMMQKIEFGSVYATFLLLMTFVLVYYKEKHRFYHYIYYAYTAISFIIVLYLPDHMQWYNFNVRYVQITWLFPYFTTFWVLIKNAKKSVDARLMLASYSLILAGIFHDIALSRGIQLFSFIDVFVTYYSMFLFMVSLALILSIRFSNFFTQIEILNETLEQKVLDRTEKLDKTLQLINLKDEKIEQELVMAGQVQTSLLPTVQRNWDVAVYVRYNPLRQVSGDFYDLVQTRDGGYTLLIADVSGHGMPAALYAILAKESFFKAIMEETSLSGVFRRVNKELGKISTGHYLTAFIVKFDRKNTLLYANAGHPKAIWLSKKQKKIKLLDTSGTIVGIRDDADTLFRDSSILFEPGDRIILYTDCLIERTNCEGEPFGEGRLLGTLKKYFFHTIHEIIDYTMNEFYEFTEGSENKDDLTLIGMEVPEIQENRINKISSVGLKKD